MARFVGNFKVQTRNGYDAFMNGIGVPNDMIEKGRNAEVFTEITYNGDTMTVQRRRPQRTTTNSFKFGEAVEMDTIKGDKIKVTVNIDGEKMVAKGDNYEIITTVDGGRMTEKITLKGHTMERISVKQ